MREQISDLVERILGAQIAAEPQSAAHYFLCAKCGQAIDARSLTQILHHLTPEHRRLSEAELTGLHPFAITRCGSKIVLSAQSELPYTFASAATPRFWLGKP